MKKQSRICILICLLVFSLLLCSCGWFKSAGKLREDVTVMLDAVIANDFDTFYQKISAACSEEEAHPFFEGIREYLGGATTYELELYHVSTGTEDGVRYRTEQYRVITDVGVYFVEIDQSSDVEGISGFRITNEDEVD